jgi:hypothetical protein
MRCRIAAVVTRLPGTSMAWWNLPYWIQSTMESLPFAAATVSGEKKHRRILGGIFATGARKGAGSPRDFAWPFRLRLDGGPMSPANLKTWLAEKHD